MSVSLFTKRKFVRRSDTARSAVSSHPLLRLRRKTPPAAGGGQIYYHYLILGAQRRGPRSGTPRERSDPRAAASPRPKAAAATEGSRPTCERSEPPSAARRPKFSPFSALEPHSLEAVVTKTILP